MQLPKLTIFLLAQLAFVSLNGQTKAAINHIGDEARRGPSQAAIEKAAKNSTAEADHYAAMKFYERLIQADSNSNEALKGYAESAFSYSAFEAAESALQNIVDRDGENSDPGILMRLADSKYRLAKYSEAKDLYQKVLVRAGISPEMAEAAQTGLENSDWSAATLLDTDVDLTIENLGEPVNSQFSDFGPMLRGDTLYFSSYRFPYEKDKSNPDRHLMKVMMKIASGEGNSETLTTNFNDEKRHTAHTAFNRAGTVMYYTLCDFVNTADVNCEIYKRLRGTDGAWGAAEKLPENINIKGYTATEPAIGFSKNDDQEVLFFASNRPNGKGKRDIWYSLILENGAFSEPVNIAKINSAGDEVTPFYHANSNTLYFSTDGYQTLGGKDVYRSNGKGVDWSAPEHLGSPINSSYDDVYFAPTESGDDAYFASNRKGSNPLSEEACCLDIYKVGLKKPEIIALTFNRETMQPLNGTVLRLIETSGTNEELKLNLPGNSMPLVVRFSKKYTLIASKDGFTSDTIKFETPGKPWEKLWEHKLYLRPARINLIANIFDADTKEPILAANARFADLGNFLPGGSLATGRGGAPLSQETKSNPAANDYGYMLEFNHKYRIAITKEGYTIDSADVSTQGMTESGTIVKNLYIRRGLALDVRTFEYYQKEPLTGVSVRLIEVGGKRSDLKTDPNSHLLKYGIDFERRYKIVATKDGFRPDSLEFTTTDLKKVDFQTITKDLYLRPLKPTAFLPVRLYFDNDEPDKRVTRKTTSRSYGETYFAYYPRKSEFISKFNTGASDPGEKISNETRLDDFFERDVKGGWDKLQYFTNVLRDRLESGDHVEITVKGYASPRAKTDYNKALTSRRISSVQNHFATWERGVLKKYIDNKQLIVKEEPYGEEKAEKGISDAIPDERNSVFSIEASKERRVEIIGVDIEK